MSLCFYQTDSEEDTLTDDDEDEVKKHSNDQDPGVSADYVTQQDVTLSTIPADNTTLFEIEDVQPTDTGFSWLQKNLVVQYWCGHGYSEEISGGHDSCNLTSDWLVFLCNLTCDWLVFLLPTKFRFIWQLSFKGEDFLEINQSETRICCDGHVC
jgi:hypothetical protein